MFFKKLRYRNLRLADDRRKLLFLSSLNGALEYYDFFSFTFIIYYLIQFFGNNLIEVYGIGIISMFAFMVRPLGYRLYLWLMLRYKQSSIISATSIMMALSILSTGLMPVQTSNLKLIFFWLLCGRLVQGVCFGIKIQAQVLFIKKIFPSRLHGNLGSSILGTQVGLTSAIFVHKALYAYLPESMLSWCWRIPFFIGAIGCIILYIYRISLIKSPISQQIVVDDSIHPLDKIALNFGRRVWLGLIISSMRACLIFTVFLLIPSTIAWQLKWNYQEVAELMWSATIINASCCWFSRKIIIRGNHPQSLVLVLLCLIPATLFLTYSMMLHQSGLIFISYGLLAALNGYFFVVIPLYLEILFPLKERVEIMFFISNFEYFNFNLIRRIGLIIAAIYLGVNIEGRHYAIIFLSSFWLIVFSTILAILYLAHPRWKSKL